MKPLRFGLPTRPLAVRAVLALVFGGVAISWPTVELGQFVALFGAYIFLDGIVAMVAGFAGTVPAERWGFFAEGAISCALGVAAFVHPFIPLPLLYVIATWGILTGVLEIIVAAHLHTGPRTEWLLSLAGISSVFLGMLLLTVPGTGSIAVVRVIGVYALAFSLLMFLASRRIADEMRARTESERYPAPHVVEGGRHRRIGGA
jgi:uncharacterized membrane protein HdeD (DUF308 family)